MATDRVVLNCAGRDLTKFPSAGSARFDTLAADKAIDRQRTAVEAVRTGNCVRSDLRNLLLEPSRAGLPTIDEAGAKVAHTELDQSQQEALLAALSSKDILLVQGPPGTGKTRLISQLIRETLVRDPKARVLLSSQTHVAIDNAIDRITKAAGEIRLLRIARQDSLVVADTSRQYLVDNQLAQWRQQVKIGSTAWLRAWAISQGLNADDILAGSVLRQIVHLRQQIVKHRATIKDHEARIATQKQRRGEATAGPPVAGEDVEALEREADEIRQQLDSDRRVLEQRETDLRKMRKEDADQFLKLGHDELSEWSGLLVGDKPESRQALALLDLQAQWLDRFGRGVSFYGALCERSDVVAATCIGLASLPGSSEVTYDLCIIDEASKATATEVLVPMIRAKRWVFVGDSRQLSPFEAQVHRDPALRQRFEIDSEEATETLFERLRKSLPRECQRMLRKQYRMVPAIGRLISDCFYDGEVESATRDPEPRLTFVTGRPVAWVTTRYLDDRREEKAEGSFVNSVEVDRILDLLTDFEDAIADSDDRVTVQLLSGYAAQVRHLQRTIDLYHDSYPHLDIECSTIDTVQGREADVVIFSVTRSNEADKAGFLGEFARINVALSRAKETLVIVGDDEFVRRAPGAEPLRKALRHIELHQEDCVFQAFDPPGHGKAVRR